MRFEEVWASFQAIGCIAIAFALGLALLLLLVVSPAAGALVLLVIAGFVAYRLTSARQAADERGAPGLSRAVSRFRELAGPPGQLARSPGAWTPASIHQQATVMSSADALRLGAIYRQLTDENAAIDVLEQRPGALLLLVKAFGKSLHDALSPIFFDVGRRASQPIWDRFIWPPQERLLREGRQAASVSEGEILSAEFSDAQDATTQAAQAALLAGWAPRDDVDWLLQPWSSVFGPTSKT